MPQPDDMPVLEDRLYVRVKEACKIMGMAIPLYTLKSTKAVFLLRIAGHKTLIAVKDTHKWFEALPDKIK